MSSQCTRTRPFLNSYMYRRHQLSHLILFTSAGDAASIGADDWAPNDSKSLIICLICSEHVDAVVYSRSNTPSRYVSLTRTVPDNDVIAFCLRILVGPRLRIGHGEGSCICPKEHEIKLALRVNPHYHRKRM